ncbi:MAG TPA: hypothetical protein VGD71_33305 [Kribbella sp.]
MFGALFAAEVAAVLIGITADGILGDLAGIIPVLIAQGLGFIVGGAVVLSRRRLFAASGTPDRAQVDPTAACSPWLKSVSGLSSVPSAPQRRGVGMRSPRG